MWAVLVHLIRCGHGGLTVSTDIQGGVTVVSFGLRPVSRGKTAVSTLPRPLLPTFTYFNVCVFTFK